MKFLYKLGIIGCGNMGSAILKQIISSKFLNPSQILVSDHNDSKLAAFKAENVNVTKNNSYVVNNCEYVIFAVKPQAFSTLAEEIKVSIDCRAVISIMAGLSRKRIVTQLPKFSGSVVRVMPNTPAMLGSGMTIIDEEGCDAETIEFVDCVFNSVGKIVKMNESQINYGMAISGSGPAYVYLFIYYIINAAMQRGFDEETSRLLTVQMAKGAIKMIETFSDTSIQQLIDNVCSKGGTTVEAINTFKNNNLDKIIDAAITNCIFKAEQLESEL